ncbi:hypothetical protein [Embleya sp. NBC_00896]|uniref:hypothetical protein n=1 Tax=Embleya sp. NBC_00896 TaxID=2975961 RepID=UPI00386DEB8F|nr:hypothetical protein OG928_26675 [Embleya sp. NBC_00896]
MRRTITSISVWLAVTAVAVALSWWGVRSVLRNTVFEAPQAPTFTAGDEPPPPVTASPPVPDAVTTSAAPDLISATNRTPASSSAPPSTKPPTTSAPPPTQKRADQLASAVQSFEVRGGRASFKYQATSATLVAATPNTGWSVKVWPSTTWIRVDFTNNGRTSSVFVVWNGHDPTASTYEG